MEFEWDENKRLSNLEEHEIDVEDLDQLFDGHHTVTTASDYELENRYLTVGDYAGRFITVVWTNRGTQYGSFQHDAPARRKSKASSIHETCGVPSAGIACNVNVNLAM